MEACEHVVRRNRCTRCGTDVDDLVEEWHTAPDGSRLAALDLHEHLGMTHQDYKRWVSDPKAV